MALAVINPEFTPRELVEQSKQIVRCQLTLRDETLRLTDAQALLGELSSAATPTSIKPPPSMRQDAWPTGTALMFFGKFSPRPVVHVDGRWFVLDGKKTVAELVADKGKLDGVWRGDTNMLMEAVSYCLTNPRARFPVAAGVKLGEPTSLANTDVAARIQSVCLGEKRSALFIASPQGSQLLEWKDGRFVDTAEGRGLAVPADHAVWIDLNQDQRLDLLTVHGQQVQLRLQSPKGVWSPSVTNKLPGKTLALVVGPSDAGPILGAATDRGLVRIGYQNEKLHLDVSPIETPQQLLTCDISGDGVNELLRVDEQKIYASSVLHRFAKAGHCESFAANDLNNDGRLDLVLVRDGSLCLLINEGKEGLRDISAYAGDAAVYATGGVGAVTVADFNQDGLRDLIVSTKSSTRFLFNRGFCSFALAEQPALKFPANAIVDDWNADGLADIALRPADGKLSLRQITPNDTSPLGVRIIAPQATEPIAITATYGKEKFGAQSLPPGGSVFFGKTAKGPLTLTWIRDGALKTKRVLVLKSVVEVVIDP